MTSPLGKENRLSFLKINQNLKIDHRNTFKITIKDFKILPQNLPFLGLVTPLETQILCPTNPKLCIFDHFQQIIILWDQANLLHEDKPEKYAKNRQKWPFWAIFSTYDVIMTS